MTDEEFLCAFDDTTLEPFHHRDHVRVTRIYLAKFGEERTRELLGPAILRYAAARGAANKYHHTITIAWIRLVALGHPGLDDKSLLDRYYSRAVLDSQQAREHWVEPDLQPLDA